MLDALTWPVGRATHRPHDHLPVGAGPALSVRPAPVTPIAAYVMACIVAGAVSGVAVAATGLLTRQVTAFSAETLTMLMAPVVVLAIVAQFQGSVAPLAQVRRQVPRRWLLWRRRTATALAFGAMIGTGALTYLQHATAWVLASVLIFAPSLEAGGMIGGIYGASRAFPVLHVAVRDRLGKPRSPWHARGLPRSRLARALCPVAAVAFASVSVL